MRLFDWTSTSFSTVSTTDFALSVHLLSYVELLKNGGTIGRNLLGPPYPFILLVQQRTTKSRKRIQEFRRRIKKLRKRIRALRFGLQKAIFLLQIFLKEASKLVTKGLSCLRRDCGKRVVFPRQLEHLNFFASLLKALFKQNSLAVR